MEWKQFLSRFRPAAVPGAAGPGSMPVDRTAEAAAELAPVFALLAATEDDAERIVAEGVARAARIRSDADRAAAAVEADAAARAPQERARAAQDAETAGTEAGTADDRDRAQQDARAEQRAELVGRAVDDVRALLGLPDRR